jgi:hypothetical protein
MERKRRLSGGPGLEAVRQQIEHWRRTRAKLSPMPEPLWEAAVTLVRAHGVRATAVGLSICYKSLRKRLEVTAARAPLGKVAATRFVQVYPAAPALTPNVIGPSDSIVLELSGAAGQRLTLRLSHREQLEPATALVRACWSQLT